MSLMNHGTPQSLAEYKDRLSLVAIKNCGFLNIYVYLDTRIVASFVVQQGGCLSMIDLGGKNYFIEFDMEDPEIGIWTCIVYAIKEEGDTIIPDQSGFEMVQDITGMLSAEYDRPNDFGTGASTECSDMRADILEAFDVIQGRLELIYEKNTANGIPRLEISPSAIIMSIGDRVICESSNPAIVVKYLLNDGE